MQRTIKTATVCDDVCGIGCCGNITLAKREQLLLNRVF